MTFRIPFSYYKLKAVGTKVHPFGTSIREFELSFLISVPLNDQETDLLNLPFIILFHFSFSCDTGKQVFEILMLFFCFIEISLALLTKPEACRTSCYLEKAWKPRKCFGRPALTFNVYNPFLRPLGMKRKSNLFNAEAKATKV